MYVIGVDCGSQGAIACVWTRFKKVRVVRMRMTQDNTPDVATMGMLLEHRRPDLVVIEVMRPMGMVTRGNQYQMGRSYGAIEAWVALEFAGANVAKVQPAVWKRKLGLAAGATKADSCALARKMYAGWDVATLLPSGTVRKGFGTDGDCEAALIAACGAHVAGTRACAAV